MENNIQESAFLLLLAIWRGIPAGYKSRYRATIWRQFEDDVRAAAYTSNLSRFYQKITGRLGVRIQPSDLERVQTILGCGKDREILRMIRDEAALLILQVRLENQHRRDEWLANQEQEEKIQQIPDEIPDEEFWASIT